jgi:glucose-1-phosphate adenylyltransferase
MKVAENIKEKYTYPINQVLGVILGGGKGTRLYPLTKDRSKPAVPFGGNYRLIDIPISNCINSGINRVFVMTQFNSASLNRHVVQTYKFDIFHNGFVDILATEQTVDNSSSGFTQGTADAVRRALKHFNSFRDSRSANYVLILSGDQLYRMDYRKILACHLEHKAEITLGIIPVSKEDIPRFGILKTDDTFKITNFVEKPKAMDVIKGWEIPKKFLPENSEGKSYFGSMGMYIFNIDTLYDILLTHPEMLDFGKEILPYSIENKYRVYGFVHDEYWEDIGTIKSFHTANIELTKQNAPFNLYEPDAPFFSHPRFLSPSEISSAEIERCMISDGIIIQDARLKNSIIGVRSIIKKGVHMENTFMIGADFYETEEDKKANREKKIPIPDIGIGENTVIKNAILDKNCRIGKNVKIINADKVVNKEERDYSIVDGIVVVPKNAVIGDGTTI